MSAAVFESARSELPFIPDYELLHPIGRGAYGEVWLARNLTGSRVALKIVRRAAFEHDRPFAREFEGIRRFEPISRSDPSQVAILHIGQGDGFFYYVMELADPMPVPPGATPGEPPYRPRTLKNELYERGALPAPECLAIATALTRALGHLHGHGLVHRDVKPSNVIFVQNVAKLADIGLVSSVDATRSFVGTEGYLPLEGAGTPQADLYGLGKVLYEMSTGSDRSRFPSLPPDFATRPDRDFLAECNAIVLKACAASSRERYESADAMMSDLELLQSGKSVKSRPVWRGWTKLGKRAIALGVAGMVASFFLLEAIWKPNSPVSAAASSPEFKKSGATNRAAWEALLRSDEMSRMSTPAGRSNSIVELERALALDPGYGAAWDSLASRLLNSGQAGTVPAKPAAERALAAAKRALEINPGSADACEALAGATLALTLDWARAEPLYRRAVELEPGNHHVRANYAIRLGKMGRFREAERFFQQILTENPGEGRAYASLADLYAAEHRFSEALEHATQAIRLDPDRAWAYGTAGEVYWSMGRFADATQHWCKALRRSPGDALDEIQIHQLEQLSRRGAPQEFVNRWIEMLEAKAQSGTFVSSYELAKLHRWIGRKDSALDYLEKSVEEHRFALLGLKFELAFAGLREEPRFRALLKRLKVE